MKMTNFFKSSGLLVAFLSLGFFTSCIEDDTTPDTEDPIASFQFAVNENNFSEVTFTNFSQNASSYSWDFGDGSAANTTESPTYEYSEAGTYTVTLSASNDEGTSATKSEVVTITDPLAAQRALIGDAGKVWQLVADNSTGVNPLEVGPTDRSGVWFALAEICSRECIFDDTWTFNTDGTFTFENNGDAFAEGGVFADNNETCFDTSTGFAGVDGVDLSDWNSGTHDFAFDASASTLTITGGFIGLMKVGSEKEYTTPQASVTYKVVKLTESETVADTLVLETILTDDAGVEFGYWAFTLVSYANASDALVIEECPVDEKIVIDAVSIDFESDAPTFAPFGGTDDAGGGVVASTIANPDASGINTSGMVGSLEEPDASKFYTGAATTLSGYVDLSTKQTFSMKVWSPAVGETIKFKMEDSTNADINAEIDQVTTVANEWETLTFTFSADDSEKFDVIALFFNFDPNGDQSVKTGTSTHYFDDIILE